MTGNRNICLLVEYDGTNYHGWQRQKNAVSLQETLEEALNKLTGEPVRVIGAGRTDAGVHARGQVVNFKMKKPLPLHNIVGGVNANLPPDIVVKTAEEVPATFHARFDAEKRIYQYFILRGRTAIHRNFCWQFFQKIDKTVLPSMAKLILGENDFSAFSRVMVDSSHKICRVYESQWREEGEFLIYRIMANRFIHGMVRTIVGTMIDVARGRFTLPYFKDLFDSKDRNRAGGTAPACGLILEEVVYPGNVRQNKQRFPS